jgi:DME family drug/metabolite transporter
MARMLVLLSAVCFGTTGTAQALGPDAAPVTVGAVRIAIGGALLLLVARTAPVAAARWPRRELGAVAAAIAVYQLAFFAAVDRTGVAVGTVVALGSAPAIAGVTGLLMDREPLTGRWAAATALACAGVLLLVLGGGETSVDRAPATRPTPCSPSACCGSGMRRSA